MEESASWSMLARARRRMTDSMKYGDDFGSGYAGLRLL